MKGLSKNLRPLYELELEHGNVVERVDAPAGTECPLAVIFENPLHFEEAETQGVKRSAVSCWENVDPHYPRERGYLCEETRQVLAGPLVPVQK